MTARYNPAQAAIDLPLLPLSDHHRERQRCEWCLHPVFIYATTPDGARHYCRSCIPRIRSYLSKKEGNQP